MSGERILTAEAERETLVILIENAAKAIRAAASMMAPNSPNCGLVVDVANRKELGLTLGRLHATISETLSVNLADQDYAIRGMTEQQEWFRHNLTRRLRKSGE